MKFKIITIFLSLIVTISYSQDWKTYPHTPTGSLITFSQDEGRHAGEPIEWWYTSGHFTGDTSGKEYSFMLTYFHYPVVPFDGFRILNITDHDTGEFFQATEALTYLTLATDRVDIEAAIFGGGIETWTNKTNATPEIVPFEYVMSAATSFGSIDFEMETTKRPLIVDGDGYLNQGLTNYTYYYSQTMNTLTGSVTLNGVTENVTGTAWIDRQYGNFNPLTGEEYEWFSLQLSNGMDINLWNIFTEEDTIPETPEYRILSAYVDESTQYTTSDFEIERLAFNCMPDDVMCYSKQWRLTSTTNNIDLVMSTEFENSEVQLPFRFFEGSITISGTVNGNNVTGIGFAELLHDYDDPEITFTSPTSGVYDPSMPIEWQLDNPDEGRDIFYNLEYSIDNQANFLPIVQGLTDTSYLWEATPLSNNDEVFFRIYAYSVDEVLNNLVVSDVATVAILSLEEQNGLNVSFYPNPVKNNLYLNIPTISSETNVTIYDSNGRLIRHFEWTATSSYIDVKDLSSGNYFIHLKNDSGESVLKFIKK